MTNIIDQLKSAISPEVLETVTQTVNEPKENITKALSALFPILVGGIIKKGETESNTGILDKLTGLLKDQATNTDNITSDSSHLGDILSGKGDIANQASQFISLIFGNKAQELTSVISSYAGIKSDSASSLLKLASTFVMGALSKIAATNNFSPAALLSSLTSQKGQILSAAPLSLLGTLGLDKLENLTAKVEDATKDLRKNNLAKIIVIALAVIVVCFFLLRSCTNKNDVDAAVNSATNAAADTTAQVSDSINNAAQNVSGAATSAVNQATDAGKDLWAHLGKLTAVTLPNGSKLNVPQNGVENKLLAFIQDPQRTVNNDSWFSFDRLVFNTGSATLAAQSNEQLDNIAQLLKAYPKVNLLIGGYTDNTGTSSTNMTLSQERADVVKTSLVNRGINADRLEAKGYGDTHPVASNDTDEGRAKNRRIDILITQK